eukprot:EC722651.1.p1 GENE.EC722651.1~~EC722651.1.p1  ORF type:complete len:96 (+),score=13.38 EC722651.1:136-423(+)
MSLSEKITEIEKEMARTQKNKGTSMRLGLLKAELARYRQQLLDEVSKGKGGGAGAGEGFDVSRSGDASIGLSGFTSGGKSTLLNKLTGTYSAVAS